MRQEELVLAKKLLAAADTLATNSDSVVKLLANIAEKLEAIAEELCEHNKHLETKGG